MKQGPLFHSKMQASCVRHKTKLDLGSKREEQERHFSKKSNGQTLICAKCSDITWNTGNVLQFSQWQRMCVQQHSEVGIVQLQCHLYTKYEYIESFVEFTSQQVNYVCCKIVTIYSIIGGVTSENPCSAWIETTCIFD